MRQKQAPLTHLAVEVGSGMNALGNAQRSISCGATWNGADFVLDPPEEPMMVD